MLILGNLLIILTVKNEYTLNGPVNSTRIHINYIFVQYIRSIYFMHTYLNIKL